MATNKNSGVSANITTSTHDTREAAALATFGYPVQPEVVYDDKTGSNKTTFHVQLASVFPDNPVSCSKLKQQLRHKELPQDHPILDCLRGMHNRKKLIQFLKTGKDPVQIGSVAGGSRTVLVDGYLLGKQSNGVMVSTRDIKVAASFCVIGIPLLTVEGQSGHNTFFFPEFGNPLKGRTYNAGQILKDFRDGTLAKNDPKNPFLCSMLGLNNYASLVQAVDRQVELVLLRKKGSKLAAYVRADATDHAFDRVKEHFGV